MLSKMQDTKYFLLFCLSSVIGVSFGFVLGDKTFIVNLLVMFTRDAPESAAQFPAGTETSILFLLYHILLISET